jgi:hypothetical protein
MKTTSRENKNSVELQDHLTIWQDHMDIRDFFRYCKVHQDDFKCQTVKHIKEKKYKSILDAAAGVCSMYYLFHKEKYKINYTATEITPKYVELCQEQGIDIIHANIEHMPFEDNNFECTVAFDVINHQVDYRDSIKELLRVTQYELFISFFKKFEEEVTLGVEYSGNYKTHKTELGLIEDRIVHDGHVVCIYNFINREKFINFLDSLNVKYVFYHDPCGREMLRITKSQ